MRYLCSLPITGVYVSWLLPSQVRGVANYDIVLLSVGGGSRRSSPPCIVGPEGRAVASSQGRHQLLLTRRATLAYVLDMLIHKYRHVLS
ncbi:unnamed protein product [Chondrus crispus]|uniref:Uncharacterized protein n=1 Tax=Chondrus crispus TaxID=2769 RepID=R7QNB8_CHOCR|nr:unnamed protein product [Chondrus crispus]CDF38966.1 unnamed protein product [Chondrus crispus]|eukprot:XP_005718871.1 unnamed protein product [Chondrus crispus]